jgi:hypothetical protein
MAQSPLSLILVSILTAVAAILIASMAATYGRHNLLIEILSHVSGLLLLALSFALLFGMYARHINKGWADTWAQARKNPRRPLVLYGFGLLVLSFIWAAAATKLVDPNSSVSAAIVLGGSLLISSIGLALIAFRIWTNLSELLWPVK